MSLCVLWELSPCSLLFLCRWGWCHPGGLISCCVAASCRSSLGVKKKIQGPVSIRVLLSACLRYSTLVSLRLMTIVSLQAGLVLGIREVCSQPALGHARRLWETPRRVRGPKIRITGRYGSLHHWADWWPCLSLFLVPFHLHV
jgi:hypothetical protein